MTSYLRLPVRKNMFVATATQPVQNDMTIFSTSAWQTSSCSCHLTGNQESFTPVDPFRVSSQNHRSIVNKVLSLPLTCPLTETNTGFSKSYGLWGGEALHKHLSTITWFAPSTILEMNHTQNTNTGYAVAQLAETLCYKPEGREFDSRRTHWNFQLT
jgi:hypothetical protein